MQFEFLTAFHFCKIQIQTKTSRVIPRASRKQYLQRLLTGAEIFKMGSQWRPQIKFDVQSQPQETRSRASSIPPAVAELVWSISVEVVASAYLPEVLAEGIICGVWNPHTSPAWLGSEPWCPCLHKASPSAAAASCCCSFPAGGRVLGTVGPCAEWAEKGESGIVGIATVFAYYPLFSRILSWSRLWRLAPLEHDFHLLTYHKGSKKTCFFVHVNYVTITDRNKNPVLSFQLKHTTLVDGVKSIFCLFRPAACSCTFHEQNGLWVISQFVNILDKLFGVPNLCQQIWILVLVFTETKISLWVDVIKPSLGYH